MKRKGVSPSIDIGGELCFGRNGHTRSFLHFENASGPRGEGSKERLELEGKKALCLEKTKEKGDNRQHISTARVRPFGFSTRRGKNSKLACSRLMRGRAQRDRR